MFGNLWNILHNLCLRLFLIHLYILWLFVMIIYDLFVISMFKNKCVSRIFNFRYYTIRNSSDISFFRYHLLTSSLFQYDVTFKEELWVIFLWVSWRKKFLVVVLLGICRFCNKKISEISDISIWHSIFVNESLKKKYLNMSIIKYIWDFSCLNYIEKLSSKV